MGWFDCVASRYGCRLQGTTDVAFTVLDVLGYLDEIFVCTGYEIDGEVTTDFPVTHRLEKAKPVLTALPGWKQEIRGIRRYEDLPENCRRYVEFIEDSRLLWYLTALEGMILFTERVLSKGRFKEAGTKRGIIS